MTVCLTACSGKKEQLLSGTYTAENSSYQIIYTFDEKKKVTLRCFSEVASVYSQEGTYGISDDSVLIILSFSPNNASEIPEGLTVQSGEFLFKQENDSIQIGNQEYQRIGRPLDTSLNISEEEAEDNTSAVKN